MDGETDMANADAHRLRDALLKGLATAALWGSLLMSGAFIATRLPQLQPLAQSLALAPWTRAENWLRAAAVAVLIGAAAGFLLWLRPPAAASRPRSLAGRLRWIVYPLLVAGLYLWDEGRRSWSPTHVRQTEHFEIASRCPETATTAAGERLEKLWSTYHELFPPGAAPDKRLQVRLYASEEELRFTRRATGPEASHYARPTTHACLGEDEVNPHVPLLRAAAEQLWVELGGHEPEPWLAGGLADYFAAASVSTNRLDPDKFDPGAFPAAWLPTWHLTGQLTDDLADGVVRSLADVLDDRITGQAAALHRWTLVHFLMEFHRAKYRGAFRELLAEGGSQEAFARRIGTPGTVQSEWYVHVTTMKTESLHSTQNERLRRLGRLGRLPSDLPPN